MMNLENFKPLLAVEADLEVLQFPVYVSAKLDGLRCVVINGKPMSRKLKDIPNKFIQSKFAEVDLTGLDGELIVGSPVDPKVFGNSTSGIMSHDGEPDFKYYVFDRIGEAGYQERWMTKDIEAFPDWVVVVKQVMCHNLAELAKLEERAVQAGYEGVMLRSVNGRYKQGRSTLKEGILLKVKRFEDTELVVCGFEERMHNANEAKTNALGQTERSSHKENLVGRGDLGALICEFGCDTVKVGTGFDDTQRAEIWANKQAYLGKLAKVKHQPSGAKLGGTLRFPVFLGWRDWRDSE